MTTLYRNARDFLNELRRRRVFRVTGIYAVIAWLLIQVAATTFPALLLPDWTVRLVIALFLLGLPVVVVLAWMFDITPEGVERTRPLADEAAAHRGPPPPRRTGARRVGLFAAVVVLTLAGGAFLTLRPATDASDELDSTAVVVLPFRVSADPALAYLGEGMVDLLAAKLTGEAGPRALDSRAVLRLWTQSTRGGAAPMDREGALAMARSMAAGQLLLGEVVGSPGRLTISATLHDVAHGVAGRPVTVTGAADSLPWLVDRVVAGLLSTRAGEDASRLAVLTSASLPALRAYLAGKQAYRGGRFGDAAAHFRRAVEIDSTFALAGLELILAGTWTDGTPVELGRRVAWQGRDRLAPRDRRRVELDNLVHLAEQLRGWEALVSEQPDDAESWMELGELLLHGGPDVGMADAFTPALHAFERSVAIDSIYAPALYHAIEIRARSGDTAQVRRLAHIYFHRNAPESGYHSYIGWRTALALGDEGLLDEMRSNRFGQMPYHDLWYVTMLGQTDALPVEDVELALEARQQRAATGAERAAAAVDRFHYLLNAGRPAAAERVRAESSRDADPAARADLLAVRAATFLGGDAGAGHAAARRLAARVADAPQSGPGATQQRLQEACALEEHRLAAGDASGTTETLRALDRLVATARADSTELNVRPRALRALEVQARRCGLYVDAWRSALVQGMASAELASRLAALESVLSTAVVSSPDAAIGNLVAARLHAARGGAEAALRAARRRSYYGEPWLLVPLLQQEAQLAEQTGDAPGAIRAWTHYLHLRSRPEPVVMEEVGHARARLDALNAGSGRR